MDEFSYNEELKNEFPSPVMVSLKDLYPDENPEWYGAGFLNVVAIEKSQPVFRDASFSVAEGENSFTLTPVNDDGTFRLLNGTREIHIDASDQPDGVWVDKGTYGELYGVINILYTLSTGETTEGVYDSKDPTFTFLMTNHEDRPAIFMFTITSVTSGGVFDFSPRMDLDEGYGLTPVGVNIYGVPYDTQIEVTHTVGGNVYSTTLRTPKMPPVLSITENSTTHVTIRSNYEGIGPNVRLNVSRNGLYLYHLTGGVGGPWNVFGNAGETWCFGYELIHVGGSNPNNLTTPVVCHTFPIPSIPTKIETSNRSAWGTLGDNHPFNSAPRVQSRTDYGTTQLIGGPLELSIQVYRSNTSVPVLEFEQLDTLTSPAPFEVFRNGTTLSTGSLTTNAGYNSFNVSSLPVGWSEVKVRFQTSLRFGNFKSSWKQSSSMQTISPASCFLQSFGGPAPTFDSGGMVTQFNAYSEFEFNDSGRIGGILIQFGGRLNLKNWTLNRFDVVAGNPVSDLSKVHYTLKDSYILRSSPSTVKIACVNGANSAFLRSFLFVKE